MCIRAGKDELESVKNLMSMSLKAVVATALHADMEIIEDRTRLVDDLHMDESEAEALQAMIADVFDGLQVNPHETATFAELLDRVVLNEFRDVEQTEADHKEVEFHHAA